MEKKSVLRSIVRYFAGGQLRRKTRPASPRVETLEVREVLTAPYIQSFTPLDGSTLANNVPAIQITYSEPMVGDNLAGTGVANVANYLLVNGLGNPVPITAASVDGTGQVVTLQVNNNDGLPLDTYTLFVRGDQVFDQNDGLSIAGPNQLIVANAGRSNVAALDVASNGSLGALSNYVIPQIGSIGPSPWAVRSADLNGDGRADLVIANAGTNTVSIYLGRSAEDGLGFDTTPSLTLALPFGGLTSGVIQDASDTAPIFINSLAHGLNTGDRITVSGVTGNTAANGVWTIVRIDADNFFLIGSVGNGTYTGGGTWSTVQALPKDLVVRDFDGDGGVDIAVMNFNTDNVTYFRSTFATSGTLSFANPVTLGGANNPTAMTAGDIDGDGLVDLIVVNSGNDTVRVWRNNGSGGFFAGQNFSTGVATNPTAVTLGHFNSDTRLDIAVAGDDVAVLTNNSTVGTIAFNPAVDATGAGATVALVNLATARIDGNNTDDLIGSSGGNVVVLLNQSNTTAPLFVTVNTTLAGTGGAVTVTNFDGGQQDVVFTGGTGSNTVQVVTGTTAFGGITSASNGTPIVIASLGHGLVTGDRVRVSGVLGNTAANNTWTVTRLSDDTFSLQTSSGNGAYLGGGVWARIGNLTSASVPAQGPVVVTTNTPHKLTTGTRVAIGGNAVANGFWTITVISATQFSLDDSNPTGGTPGSASGGTFEVAGPIGFGTAVTVPNTPLGVTTLDANGDGRLDVVTANFGANSFTILPGNGDRTFLTPPTTDLTATPPGAIAYADLNGDGIKDIILANTTTNTATTKVSVLLGNRDGSFQAPVDFSPLSTLTFHSISSIAVGDVTGDGRPDIVVTGQTANFSAVAVLTNNITPLTAPFPAVPPALNGSSFISGSSAIQTGPSPTQVVIGDFNGDGLADLAVSHNQAGGTPNSPLRGVSIHTGVGGGAFTSAVEVPVAAGLAASGLAVLDFNKDGILDLAVIENSVPGRVLLLKGNGSGGFTSAGTFNAGVSNPVAILTGDFNGDGWTDVAVASGSTSVSTGGIAILLNEGGTGLRDGRRTEVVPGSAVRSLAVTDANEDGRADLVVGTQTGFFANQNNVYLLAGKGDGTFASPTPYLAGNVSNTPTNPTLLAVGDSPLVRITSFTTGGKVATTDLLTNGDFESRDLYDGQGNLIGWNTYKLPNGTAGSAGSWGPQSGSLSPQSGTPIAHPEGQFQAMLDQPNVLPLGLNGNNPNPASSYSGTHALYQDIFIPANATSVTLSLRLYVNSTASFSNTTGLNPVLDFRGQSPNQQVRVDVMRPNANILSVASGDVLLNIHKTDDSHARVQTIELSSADLMAFRGQTVRIRIAASNNQGRLIVGVDDVNLKVTVTDNVGPMLVGRGPVRGASNAGPIVINSPNHGLYTGEVVRITGVTGNTAANGTWTITRIDANRFSLNNSRGNGAYAGGGTWDRAGPKLRTPGPVSAGWTMTTDPTITGRVTDNLGLGNVAYVEIDPNGTSFAGTTYKITSFDALGNFVFTFPQLALGRHTVGIRAVDRAGNVSVTTLKFEYQALFTNEWRAVGPTGINLSDASLGYEAVTGRITSTTTDTSDPTGKTYYVGTTNGGVWKTTDGGASWTPLLNTITAPNGQRVIPSIGALATAPSAPRIVYAGLGVADLQLDSRAGSGILKSTNGGATWQYAGNSARVFADARISKIVVHPTNANIVYVAVAAGGQFGPGVYRSTNGGTTWANTFTPASAGLPAGSTIASVTDLLIDPFNPLRVLIGVGNVGLTGGSSDTAGIYLSVNGGVSWTNRSANNPALPAAADMGSVKIGIGTGKIGDERHVYALIGQPASGGTSIQGLIRDYQLNGNFLDAFGGPALVPNGGTIGPTGYTFGAGQGLTLSNALPNPGNYSIEITFHFDDVSGVLGGTGYTTVIDFMNRTSDAALTAVNTGPGTARLDFFPSANGIDPFALADGVSVTVLFTRDATTEEVVGYVNSVEQFRFFDVAQDAVFAAAANIMNFVQDNVTGPFPGEEASGFVDSIRIWDRPIIPLGALNLGGAATLYKSSDNLNTFTQVMLRQDIDPTAIGRDFQDINLGGETSYSNALAVDPSNPHVVYVGGSRKLDPNNELVHALIRVDTSNMSATTGNDRTKDTFGADEGVPWFDLEQNATSGVGPYRLLPPTITTLQFDNQGRLLIGTDGGIWRATSLGFGYDFSSGGTGIIINNAGAPAGMLVEGINGNLQITSVTSSAVDPSNADRTYATLLGYGGAVTDGPLNFTSQSLTGPTVNGLSIGVPDAVLIRASQPDPTAPPDAPTTLYRVWRNAADGALVPEVSFDNGRTWQQASPLPSAGDAGGFAGVLAIGLTKVTGAGGFTDEILFGTDRVYQTRTSGNVWDEISPVLTSGGSISALGIAPNRADTTGFYYAGTSNGQVFVAPNGGGTQAGDWLDRSAGLPTGLPVTSIAVSANNPNVAYVTFGGTGSTPSRIYRTTNGGLTWTSMSGNLPKQAIYAVVFDQRRLPGAPNGKLYVATETGVFVTATPGNPNNWRRVGTLPSGPVVDLSLDPTTETLSAAVQGRGVFQLSVAAISPIADQVIDEDTSTGPIKFTLNTLGVSVGFSVRAVSDNQDVVQNRGIVLGGTGGIRTIRINPVTNASGVANITLFVSDGTRTYSTTFQVTVNEVNDAPIVSVIPDQLVALNGSTGQLGFTVSDVDGTVVSVTATSDNQTFIPDGNIFLFGGTGFNQAIEVTPATNQTGTARISIFVTDDRGATTVRTFDVKVEGVADLPFADGFDRGSNTFLGDVWTDQVGNWDIVDNAAVPQTAGALATLNGIAAADVGTQADVHVTPGSNAYLVARYSPDGRYYMAGLVATANGVTANLFKRVNGQQVRIGTAVSVPTGTGTLRFEVVGNSLKLFLNGVLVNSASDASITAPGTVGLRGAPGATFDNFVADEVVRLTPTIPFNDFFDMADNQQLDRHWEERVGSFKVDGGVVTGNTPLALATLNFISETDVVQEMAVSVAAGSGQVVSLVARYQGNGDRNMYMAGISGTANRPTAVISRNVNGTWTSLTQIVLPEAVAPGRVASGTLRFEVVGSSLKLFLNDNLVAFANDFAITAPGSVGIRVRQAGSLDNYHFDLMQRQEAALPYFDGFDSVPGDRQQLSSDWTNLGNGNVTVDFGVATGNSQLAFAVLNGVSVANVSLSVDINVNPGQMAGLVARANERGTTFYQASVVFANGLWVVRLHRFVNGNATLLASAPMTFGTGTLGMTLDGSSITVSMDGGDLFTVQDFGIMGPGTVGIRGTGRPTWDDFSAFDF